MADFKDLEEGQTAKWQEILSNNNVTTEKSFPWGYYDHSIGGTPIMEIAKEHPKKAICQLFFYSLLSLMKTNPLDFITKPEINIEFNDLFTQALNYDISIPSSK